MSYCKTTKGRVGESTQILEAQQQSKPERYIKTYLGEEQVKGLGWAVHRTGWMSAPLS